MKNTGKELEKVVELLERSISPNAVVQHDMQLSVIGSESGRTRQCDVVIRSNVGTPRETITIVEVQDRKTQVDINTFGGWQKKREEVDAQHLICVSRHDFPQSIKEEVAKCNNTVKLVVFKEMDNDLKPMDFCGLVFKFHNIDIKDASFKKFSGLKKRAEELGVWNDFYEEIISKKGFQLKEKIWSFDKENMLSLSDIIEGIYGNIRSGKCTLKIEKQEDNPLYISMFDEFIHIGIELDFIWINEVIDVPINVFTYEQNDHGTLAWIADVQYESPRGLIEMKIPIIKNKNNRYDIPELKVDTLPTDVSVSLFEITKKREDDNKN